MTPIRPVLAHARSVAWLVRSLPRHSSGGSALGMLGGMVGVLALFEGLDSTGGDPVLAVPALFVVVVLGAIVLATWRTPHSGSDLVLPVDDRTRSLVEGGLLTLVLTAGAIVVRLAVGLVLGHVPGMHEVSTFGAAGFVVLPFFAGVAILPRPDERVVLALLALPFLAVAGVVRAGVVLPLPAVPVLGLLLTALVVGPGATLLRTIGWGRRGSGYAGPLSRPVQPGEERLRADLCAGLARPLPATLLAMTALGAALIAVESVWPGSTLVGLLFGLTVVPRVWLLMRPLGFPFGAVIRGVGHEISPTELLPVSRAALTRALGVHVLTVTGAMLVLDAAVLVAVQVQVPTGTSFQGVCAVLSLMGVIIGGVALRRWITGGIGWPGVLLVSLTFLMPGAVLLQVLFRSPLLPAWAVTLGIAALAWLLVAVDARHLARSVA